MKIAGVASESGKKEINARASAAGVDIAWVETAEDLGRHTDATAYFDLSFDMHPERIRQLGRLLPRPVIIHSVVDTLETVGSPFIRINAWPGFLERKVCELVLPSRESVHSDKPARREDGEGRQGQGREGEGRDGQGYDRKAFAEVFEELNWPYLEAPDIPGMITARILASIINEAYYTLEAGVSSREDIDTAMKWGTNYPFGPFEWSARIGLRNICSLLDRLAALDPRYQCSDLLRKEAGKCTV